MAKSKSTRRPKAPANLLANNQLVDAGLGPIQTIEDCRSIIEYVRQTDVTESSEDIKMGRFLVLGLVADALAHAQGEIQRQQRQEASHG